jgi:hypothetical protein
MLRKRNFVITKKTLVLKKALTFKMLLSSVVPKLKIRSQTKIKSMNSNLVLLQLNIKKVQEGTLQDRTQVELMHLILVAFMSIEIIHKGTKILRILILKGTMTSRTQLFNKIKKTERHLLTEVKISQ